MATSLAAASGVSVASFCGLKADVSAKLGAAGSVKMPAMKTVQKVCQASYTEKNESSSSFTGFQGIGMAVLAASAGLFVAASANAVTVKMGGDGGELMFVPSSITVAEGEIVTFVNNAGFPHNLVFDEDNVPAGVNAEKLSKEDYLNGPGEKVEVKFEKKGVYQFYCEPHQGAGMKGKVTVT